MMTRQDLIAYLRRKGACDESLGWLESISLETAEACWNACERGDWVIWLARESRATIDRQTWVEIACDSAQRTAEIGEAWLRVHAPGHTGAIVRAIEAARSGDLAAANAAVDGVRAVYDDAAPNAVAYAVAAASHAAWGAVNAAYTAEAAANAAAAAVDARAPTDADAWAARAAERRAQAEIVRRHITWARLGLDA